jgi:DNA modification methylase
VTSPPYFGLRDYGCAGQIGLEKTPDAYVSELVEVFREVRRVLRDDGTLWLNLGDAYGGARGNRMPAPDNKNKHSSADTPGHGKGGTFRKQRVMIPARVALALQSDGWWLRDEIIWHKPNPMPVSVTDRTTPAHEMVYMLSKSARYHYDMEAVKEPSVMRPQNRNTKRVSHPKGDAGRPEHLRPEGGTSYESRQPRSVWTVSTKPFKGAHFATFPPDLVKPCILAGCPEGGTVLDPFFGAGTTGLVAQQLGRNAIGIELNPAYATIARERISADSPLFAANDNQTPTAAA